MKKSILTAALMAITANPTMAKMRAIAYAPVSLPKSNGDNLAAKKEAEAKRLRKQARNIKNAQKHTS